LGFALAVDGYATHNYEVLKADCVERQKTEFKKMMKQTKITVNARSIGYYGFNDSADNVITLSITKTGVKLPMLHLSFKNLIKFDASYNNMDKIDDIGNETFPYLRLFNLSHNAISSVKSLVFSHLKEVEILDLSHNCFVEFHYDIVFLKHEKLKELYLHDNLLHRIHSLMQEPKVMTLDFLDISNNFVQSFTNFDIEIKHLEMRNNFIESVKILHGDQMTLNAQNNKITEFLSTESFKLLNLSYNELSYFSEVKFKEAKTVDLSHNKLEKWFEVEKSLEYEFSTDENTSETSEDGVRPRFEALRIKVEHLILAQNKINDITEISGFKNCKTLNLDGNMLKNIDLEEFRVMFPLLKRVSLNNNPLTAVDESDLKFFNSTQFLQLHFDYSFATEVLQTSTILPTLPPIFLPSFQPITKAAATAMSTPKTLLQQLTERLQTTTTHSPQTESKTHTKLIVTTTETLHPNEPVKPVDENSSKVWLLGLVFVVIIVSLIGMNYRKQKLEQRVSNHNYHEAENYF
jgi:Leucine-rich repeat (LRR) protein